MKNKVYLVLLLVFLLVFANGCTEKDYSKSNDKQKSEVESKESEKELKNNDNSIEREDQIVRIEAIAKKFGGEISDDFKTISLPEEVCEGINYSDFSKAYGFENIKYIINPESDSDKYNNLCYCILTGNFKFSSFSTSRWDFLRENNQLFFIRDCSLLGCFANTKIEFVFNKDGELLAQYNNYEQLILSEEEIHENMIQTYKNAYNIYKDVVDTGLISENMSVMKKADILKKAFCSSKFYQKKGINPNNYPNWWTEGNGLIFDSGYGAIVEGGATCLGRISGYNLLLNMDGITSCGLLVDDIAHNGNHIISCFADNGTEYVIDISGGKNGVVPLSEASDKWSYIPRDEYKNNAIEKLK